MSKRSAEEKLGHYQRKIRRIQEKNNKRRRLASSSDSLNSEINEEITYAENFDDTREELSEFPPEIPISVESQVEEHQINAPQLPPSQLLPSISNPTVDQVMPVDTQITTAPPNEAPTEPLLDPELLSALGACTSDTPDFGENIHNSLASLWLPLLRKGLPKEEKDNLIKEYLIPSNCKLLQAPKLNAEISVAVAEVVRGRDKKLKHFQQELGVGISAINRGIDTMLKSDNKALALKNLSDGCRLLTNLHHSFTKDRVKLVTPSLEKSILLVIQDTERDDTLFGNTLADKIKACKAIERQGKQIRKTNPKPQVPQASTSRPNQLGNWVGPPRYPSTRGMRGGRGRAASTATRRPYPTNTYQTSTKSSTVPKTRANAQQ